MNQVRKTAFLTSTKRKHISTHQDFHLFAFLLIQEFIFVTLKKSKPLFFLPWIKLWDVVCCYKDTQFYLHHKEERTPHCTYKRDHSYCENQTMLKLP